ncbi:hypothetical protein PanWU01x14_074230 [Parasponia andersonii]|uniref:Uncharacterized protein n=1 Tax=Parasponia andersonii TaxID=3476 RepID=A0A2P5DDB4_PARAD|nr:hypothetical protein PanWU01x14_074230 [Parasponia andersonii]
MCLHTWGNVLYRRHYLKIEDDLTRGRVRMECTVAAIVFFVSDLLMSASAEIDTEVARLLRVSESETKVVNKLQL